MKRRRWKALAVLLVLLATLGIKAWPLMAAGDVALNQQNFPDPNFLALVKQYDKDKDGYLSDAELDAVTSITFYTCDIGSLAGIEYFRKLKVLNCNGNQIQTLDLSQNTELLELYCGTNPLTTLNVSKNLKLRKLFCPNTDLSHLNISHLSELTDLTCYNTELTALDVSQNTKLNNLSCYYTHLTDLDLSNNKNLSSAWVDRQSHENELLSRWNGRSHEFRLTEVLGDKIRNVTDVTIYDEAALPDSAHYDRNTGILTVDPQEKLDFIVYFYDVKSPTLPDKRLKVRVQLLYAEEPVSDLRVKVFRTGHKASYTTGETVALAASAEGGKPPYRYQFYALSSYGMTLTLRDYAYSNTYSWVPVNPDSYEVGVNIKDANGTIVQRENTVMVIKPLKIAVFRAGHKSSYNVGETVALAARAEGGYERYRYQFYVIRSNGTRVILRNYSSSNVFSWKPVTPDTYKVGVNAKDVDQATVVNQEKTVTVTKPFRVAVFRAGYKTEYTAGETVALAARGEGGQAPLQYQFYVYRSNGAKVILKNFNSVNIFNWKPQTPDTYRVCVAIKDASGKVVTRAIYVKVK
ncbi:MAG: hypothetical protein QM296_00940 [Bacillota bacterium]|nr:hypothetical protein [Bacillota bacterium]